MMTINHSKISIANRTAAISQQLLLPIELMDVVSGATTTS